MIKFNIHDYMDGGLVPDESLEFARRMVADGIDAIEVSGGTASSPKEKRPLRRKIMTVNDEAYFGKFAALMKETVDVPVVTVGGIRSLGVVQTVLAAKTADYVALSRPFIREPHLINRWKEGDTRKAVCVSCSHCYNAAMEGNGVYCVEERKARNGRNRGMQAACSA